MAKYTSSKPEAIHNARLMVQNDKTYAYDDSGNRIRQWRGKGHATETEYRYNLAGELDQVIDKRHHWHTVAEFQYDALGRRIQKTITVHAHDDTSRIKQHYHDHYLWLGDVLLQEQRHSRNVNAKKTEPLTSECTVPEHIITYLHEPDSFRPLAQIHEHPQKHSRDIYYYQLDHLGTPMEMTNENGHIVWSANYQGFGKAKTQRGIVGNDSIRNPIRFQGQYEDEETGEAKRRSGIPVSQQPTKVGPNINKRGNVQPGKSYDFQVPAKGGGFKTVRIRDDAAGHDYGLDNPQNRGPHFNNEAGDHFDY